MGPATPRERMLAALEAMPDEAFIYLALAMVRGAMTKGALTQVWPDGTGGFSQGSKASIAEAETAANAYLENNS